ncbi:glycosyltransferase family 4 protein [Actinosynnema sp. NPDC020468]|uniref:glycosyltransferase family 4 protein n=1 Tax=Actinosynnema sp. NPDC020468 TaxID=3154488 RepID=UPI0033F2E1E0
MDSAVPTGGWDVALVAFGAPAREAWLLAEALAGLGHRVRLYSSGEAEEACRGVEHAVFRGALDAGFAQWCAAEWAVRRPEVVHTLSPVARAAIDPVLGTRPTPLVHTWRSHEGTRLWPADRFVVGGQAEAAELVSKGVARSAAQVVGDGVDPRTWTVHGPSAPRTGRARLVHRTALRPGDGVDTAIAALPWVSDAELLVLRDGDPERPDSPRELRRLLDGASALGVADRVHVVEAEGLEHVASVLRSADIALHTPWSPGSAQPVVQAMACGVPTIASEVGSLPEIVLPGITGDLVPPRDPKALGKVVRRLLGQKARLTAYSEAALDRVQLRHGWDQVATETARVYRQVISARK